jgi:hypothetical protein
MPRFVLLYHVCPASYVRPSHWDLMLEEGEILRTWALPQLPHDWHGAHQRTIDTDPDCPPLAAANSVAAEALGDHRLDYLSLEGRLSGDRGHVRRIDSGMYIDDVKQPARWQVRLDGAVVRGTITLRPAMAGWMLALEPHR